MNGHIRRLLLVTTLVWAAAALLWAAAAPVWAAAAADSAGAYPSLAGRKALARVPGSPDLFGVSYSHSTDTAASQAALANCERARPESAPRCEITRLNDETVASGRDIRARVDAGVHPLYLWRYQSRSATVFLAGSIHVLKPSLYPLPPQLEEAFDLANHLVLEVDTDSVPPAELQALSMRVALLPGQQTLANILPAPLYARLHGHLLAYGMDVANVARAKPAVIMNELVLARLTALGYLAEYGLEQHFRARAGTRPVLELESIEAQLDLLFNQPLTTQIQLLADTLDQEYEIEPLLAGLLVAWLSGNDEAFLALFQQQAGESDLARAFNRQLLDDRNVGMAAKVRHYLNGQGTYFVLAGAAHFIGPAGIVALLSEQGIAGHRVMSNERALATELQPTGLQATELQAAEPTPIAGNQ